MWGNLKEEAHRQIVVPFAVHAAKVLLFEFAMNWWWGDFFTVLTRKCSCMHVCCRYSGEGGGTYIFLDHIFWEYYNSSMFATENNSTKHWSGQGFEVCSLVCMPRVTEEMAIFQVQQSAPLCWYWYSRKDHIRRDWEWCNNWPLRTIWSLKRPKFRSVQLPWVNRALPKKWHFSSLNKLRLHVCWYWSVQRKWRAFMDLIQWYNDIIIDYYNWEPAFDHWRAGPRFWRKQPGVIAMFWRKFLGNSKLLCYSEKTHRLWDRIRHVYTWIKALALYLTSIRLGCAW